VSTTPTDPRALAFLSPGAPEIFHSVEHRHEIWRVDPFDVESLYTDARAVFGRLLLRATTPPGLPSGRILLILGESGSGKTHLLRVFRNQVHGAGDGFFGYLQMTTATSNYGRYLLGNLIDSLDQPYNEEVSETFSGMMRLSRAMASRCLGDGAVARLRDDEALGQDEVDALVRDAADDLLAKPDYAGLDLDLVRVLLYLQRDDPRIKQRVIKYLRCEDLTPADRALLGGIVPRVHDEDPGRLVEAVGRLAWRLTGKSLVMCLDQLEDVWNMDEAATRFRRAMAAVVDLADRVPSSIFVICCLEDFYTKMRAALTGAVLDRIERDPDPIRLRSERTLDEVRKLIGKRLAYLFDQMEAPFDAGDDTYPIPPGVVERWANLRTRDVLEHCRRYREDAVARGALPPAEGSPQPSSPAPAILDLEQRWNDFRASYAKRRPEEDEEIAALLAWAIGACGDELESGHGFIAKTAGGSAEVEVRRGDALVEELVVTVCNKSPRGGGLARQVADARQAAGRRAAVLVRSIEFPSKPGSKVAEEIAKVITSGGRRAVLEDADCLTMLALREFREKHTGAPNLAAWLAYENPLSQMPVLRAILDLDRFEPAGSVPTPVAAAVVAREAAPPPAVAPAPPDARALTIGRTDGINARDLLLPTDELCSHAAFLGGTGSGKTTLALGVVEQLLLQGVPVVLVDRKGDLCGYGREAAWTKPLGDPAREEHRQRLRDRVAPALYTPGGAAGRPLGITLLPQGIEDLPPEDRADEAAHAANALGDVLGYKLSGRDQSCRAVLSQALALLAGPGAPASLERLIAFIDEEDPALVSAIGRLDTKLFRKIVQDLETFKLTNAKLVGGEGERLDIDALLGKDGSVPAGKTRLSVVSTKFFGDTGKSLFWVAQLLIQLGRWASRRPSPTLQAAVLFDEADLYLPAMSQPATKAPMENLLRRARSAGLGILLATQSPGDFDYRCRDNIKTWMLGRITQPVAIQKMRPMLAEVRVDVASKLAGRQVGQFFMLRGGEATSFAARLPAIMPEQLPEAEILELARASRRSTS
jgi:energy-coupling factor transporter ATP-binding protein EcfA2